MPTLGEIMRQRLVEQQRARQGQGIASQSERHAQEWLAQQMAAQMQQEAARGLAIQDTGHNGDPIARYEETATERINRELAAQASLKVDPEVDRIASIFFNNLMERVNADFHYGNPTWPQLGAREKRHWLAATEALLDELRKEPVMKNELSAFAHRRIIAE